MLKPGTIVNTSLGTFYFIPDNPETGNHPLFLGTSGALMKSSMDNEELSHVVSVNGDLLIQEGYAP